MGQSCAVPQYLRWVEPKRASRADRQASEEENMRTEIWLCELRLHALRKAAALSAFDKSLTFTGCVEFALAGALFKYPLPARIQNARS